PIDTNLATWGTTLAMKTLEDGTPSAYDWLLGQQYQEVHPFTNAAPGGWAWTDLPGGVPDADDTAGALIALRDGVVGTDGIPLAINWLLNLQNRDGGIPTFCRGWGTLPFDRSTPELTAHALLAWWLWESDVPEDLRSRIRTATMHALRYLAKVQRADGSWIPLWFGNEHTRDEENPVYGTAQVVAYLCGHRDLREQARGLIASGTAYLAQAQHASGGWGGGPGVSCSIEETAVALHALALAGADSKTLLPAIAWLLDATQDGTHFPPAPIGLYFARLWYHERLYPVIWTLQALQSAKAALSFVSPADTNSQP
ncbi:MAG: prenyltransferase/squalene oxidase repeat-containing protein, partial [Prosthecobacter sp.]|nr:prenyltransferase/squalene oxidase repeat-containing protein [Prosthecobacter sp.]